MSHNKFSGIFRFSLRLAIWLLISLICLASAVENNRIKSVEISESADKTVVYINLESQSGYERKSVGEGKLAVIVPQCTAGKLNPKLAADSALAAVAVATESDKAVVTLSFKSNAGSYRGYATITPPRIVFEVVKKADAGNVAPPPDVSKVPDKAKMPPPSNSTSEGTTKGNVTTGKVEIAKDTTESVDTTEFSTAAATKGKDKKTTAKANSGRRGIERIIIDPGHGGPYGGTAGVTTDISEKVSTLAVAKKLKKKLEQRLGVKVYLTRRDDYCVLMRERCSLANRVKGDLLLSIHFNGDSNSKARGTEVYFFSEALTSEARAMAALENADFEGEIEELGKGTGLDFILGSMAQNQFLTESSELAELVQVNLVKKLDTKDRGVKQADFYILRYVYMPSVLVEIGFMSNKEEEKITIDPVYQDKTADAICDAVAIYKDRYEKRMGIK